MKFDDPACLFPDIKVFSDLPGKKEPHIRIPAGFLGSGWGKPGGEKSLDGAGRIAITFRNSESTATIPVLDGRGPQEISRTIQNDRLRIGWLDVHAHGNWRVVIEEEPGADPQD